MLRNRAETELLAELIEPLPALERQLRSKFDCVASFTVGAEEELMLVDPATFELTPAIGAALGPLDGAGPITTEFRASQVELVSPVCIAAADVARELVSLRRLASRRLVGVARLLAAGAHPTATTPGPITSRPRYERIAADHPLAAREMLTCGLHVHVAVSGADRALAVHNALRSYLPEILALSANAPFQYGVDSGLATVRSHLNGLLPRFGAPPAFPSWSAYAEHVAWGRDGGAGPDPSFHWWDLRLHSGTGTIEVRVADAQTRVEDTAALIALVQSLVAYLANRYSEREPLAVHTSERVAENLWLAARDGLNGSLVDLTTATPIPTSERLYGLVELLLPTAKRLGCEQELLGVARIVLEGGGAAHQHEVARSLGVSGLVRELVNQTCSVITRPETIPDHGYQRLGLAA